LNAKVEHGVHDHELGSDYDHEPDFRLVKSVGKGGWFATLQLDSGNNHPVAWSIVVGYSTVLLGTAHHGMTV
jgi:hypothetical protein